MENSQLLVNGTDIALWAEHRKSSETELPVLVRKLIRAADPSVSLVDFRDDKGAYFSGWDGIVDSQSGGAQVPAGRSLWEFSVRGDVKAKADEDYDTRTKNPLGETQQDCTLVIVTARKWAGKQEWQKARTQEGIWREVKAYDADDLAHWMEAYRAIHLVFSAQLGKAPDGARALAAFWDDWANATTWPIPPELMLAGRDREAEAVKGWIAGTPSTLNLQADTPKEAIAFLASVIESASPEERETLFGRAIIVEDSLAWQQLVPRGEPLLLIAMQPDRSYIGVGPDSGHHVYMPLGPGDPAGEDDIKLPRVGLHAAREIFEGAGIQGRIDEFTQTARHSIGAFRRLLAKNKASLAPDWAKDTNVSALLPALLLMQWKDTNQNDRAAVERLSGNDYAQTIEILRQWTLRSDPPVRVHGEVWRVVSPQDTWDLVAARLLDKDTLANFEKLALEILDDIDPQWEFTGTERMMANINGAVPEFSATVRGGVARVLALMGSKESACSADGERFVSWAKAILRKLFEGKKPWQFWASQYSTMSLLAEAAPDEFLEAVNRDLTSDNPSLVQLFREDENDFFASSPHSGLLWALETLAWSPDYVSSASLNLARLARLDPGGQISNRPFNSLLCALFTEYPCTGASMEERLQVLEMLCEREPGASWKLLLGMLPGVQRTLNISHKPCYRDWVPDEPGSITYGELWNATSRAVAWLLEDVGSDVARWCQLLEHVTRLAKEDASKVVAQLLAIENEVTEPDERWMIWDTARRQIALSRLGTHHESDEGKHRLELIESVIATFKSTDCVLASKWLFNPQAWLELSNADYPDHSTKQARIQILQHQAIEQLWGIRGKEGLIELATAVDRADAVGFAAGKALEEIQEEITWLEGLVSSEEKLIKDLGLGFISGRIAKHGQDWVLEFLASEQTRAWTTKCRAEVYRFLPFAGTTWDLLDTEDPELKNSYWQTVWAYGNPGSQAEYERALDAMEACGRCVAALEYMNHQLRNEQLQLPAERAVSLLYAAMQYDPSSDTANDRTMMNYTVGEIIKALEERDLADSMKIAQLQYAYLPIFTQRGQVPMALFKLLGEKPEVFMEVLTGAYKSEDQVEDQEEEEKEVARSRASHSFTVLVEWSLPPGVDEDGNVNADQMMSWVLKVRGLAAEADLLVPCDHHLGNVLAKVPIDEDGAWPHRALRDLIEELASQSFEDELRCGILNSRGIVSRSLGEGGKQERALADKYSAYAIKLRARWPRTSAMLRTVADSDQHHAKLEDDRSELQQDGVS